MRINEIILENLGPGMDLPSSDIEDEAHTRGDASLITALELLRQEAESSSAVTPRVRASTVVSRVQAIPGNEAFNYALLDAAFKDNEKVKAMIKSIKDDEKTGEKYVYLTPSEASVVDADPMAAGGDAGGDPEASMKTVSQMANRALAKRD
jgi:hypothetical protein